VTTVIDSLVLEFGLDPSGFTKGQREAMDQLRRFEQDAEKVGARAEQQGRKTVDMMAAFRREALGAIGALVGGIGIRRFINDMSTLDAGVGRAALTFNMSARELSTWEGAAAQAGAKAGEMRGTIGGLTQDMNRFLLTGQGTLASVLRPLGVDMFDANKNLKDAGTLILDIVGALDRAGLDPARRAAFLSMLPGMSEGSLNLMMKSRRELEEYLRLSRELGSTTADSAQKAQEYERAVANLDRAFTNLGRTIATSVFPALAGLANVWTDTLSGGKNSIFKLSEGSLLDELAKSSMGKTNKNAWDVITEWWKRINSEGTPAKVPQPPAAGPRAAATSTGEVVEYIRQAAIRRGIDPDIAVEVARREGLHKYVGDGGSSFGPFQLHYGGVNPAMPKAGLGDAFTKATGLDARDESTWRQQVDFALDQAAKPGGRGWADWYGWKGGQFAGIPRGGSTSTTTVSVGNVNVYTQATDAKGIAADIKPALERGSFTSQFNSGLE
jgi:hypothetical protein